MTPEEKRKRMEETSGEIHGEMPPPQTAGGAKRKDKRKYFLRHL